MFCDFSQGCRGDVVFFFFQAEDGIRDTSVTGVQTCALPICGAGGGDRADRTHGGGAPDVSSAGVAGQAGGQYQIGRASCRERVESWVTGGPIKKKEEDTRSEMGNESIGSQRSSEPYARVSIT